jgi:hypothetical protein
LATPLSFTPVKVRVAELPTKSTATVWNRTPSTYSLPVAYFDVDTALSEVSTPGSVIVVEIVELPTGSGTTAGSSAGGKGAAGGATGLGRVALPPPPPPQPMSRARDRISAMSKNEGLKGFIGSSGKD